MNPRGSRDEVLSLLRGIPDPELPALDIVELGIVREVRIDPAGVTVAVTPTFFGCPATEAIAQEIGARLEAAGLGPVTVRTVLWPPWTPEAIGPAAREKLRAAGISPPPPAGSEAAAPACPRCGSEEVSEVAPFGAAPCRSFWSCRRCLEPFEAIKPLGGSSPCRLAIEGGFHGEPLRSVRGRRRRGADHAESARGAEQLQRSDGEGAPGPAR